MIYMPAERPEYLNDPISAHGDQLLGQWAFDNGHKIVADSEGGPGRCQCGASMKDDSAIRAHWQMMRFNART